MVLSSSHNSHINIYLVKVQNMIQANCFKSRTEESWSMPKHIF